MLPSTRTLETMNRLLVVAFVVLAAAGPAEPSSIPAEGEADRVLWIRDVHVVPMTAEGVLSDRTLRVVDGVVDRIEPAGEAEVPAGAAVVEGRGRFLVPGLVDAHVHLNDESELLSYLAHGVTTVVNLRGSPEHLRVAEEVAAGERLGPWIYTSGPILDGDPPILGGSGTTVVSTPAEAREAVEAQADAGYDLIKVYNNVKPEVLRATVETAEEHGLAVVGHIPRNPDRSTAMQRALDAGLEMIAHGEEIFFTDLGGAADGTMTGEARRIEPERIHQAARLVAEAGATVTPNLAFVEMTRRMLEELDAVLEHPESRYLSPGVREMWRRHNPTRRDNLEAFAAREAVKRPAVRALTLELQRAGVPLLLGTDASAPGLHPGWSAILELEELVAAGLTPYEALSAGARTAGAFLGHHVPGARPVGTIEVGRAADLLLVERNPLEDISALREAAGVIVQGRWLSRDRLTELRAEALSEDTDAQTTRVQVRAVARDAKLIGDVVGGARITVTEVASGEILAEGVTEGNTGDTERIMRTPRERGEPVFDTEGAAGWLAELSLRRPTVVEIAAEGPLAYPQALARTARTMLLTPGAEILGDGIVLELNGLIVEILEPEDAPVAGNVIPVRARVRMLCSCPTEPDGLWSVESIVARLHADGEIVASAPLEFSGDTSVYGGSVRAPEPGSYVLEVVAVDPATANFGTARRELEIR